MWWDTTCKLALFIERSGGWWPKDKEVVLAQFIALAALELQVESDRKECAAFFKKHFNIITPRESTASDYYHTPYPHTPIPKSNLYDHIAILPPPVLVKPKSKDLEPDDESTCTERLRS